MTSTEDSQLSPPPNDLMVEINFIESDARLLLAFAEQISAMCNNDPELEHIKNHEEVQDSLAMLTLGNFKSVQLKKLRKKIQGGRAPESAVAELIQSRDSVIEDENCANGYINPAIKFFLKTQQNAYNLGYNSHLSEGSSKLIAEAVIKTLEEKPEDLVCRVREPDLNWERILKGFGLWLWNGLASIIAIYLIGFLAHMANKSLSFNPFEPFSDEKKAQIKVQANSGTTNPS